MRDIVEIEILKLKHSKILAVVILTPVFMVLQGVINLIRYYDLFTSKGQNVWDQLYGQSMILYVGILFPVLISIVMTMMIRIENSNNGWKHYLSLPVRKEEVYVIKFILACGLIFINILALIISMIVAGKLMGIAEAIPYQVLLAQPLGTYFAALPIMAILYVLSIRFSHIATPLGIGIGLSLPAMFVANSKYWMFYPWTYPIMVALGWDFETFNKGNVVYIISISLLVIIFLWGFRNFVKRDIA